MRFWIYQAESTSAKVKLLLPSLNSVALFWSLIVLRSNGEKLTVVKKSKWNARHAGSLGKNNEAVQYVKGEQWEEVRCKNELGLGRGEDGCRFSKLNANGAWTTIWWKFLAGNEHEQVSAATACQGVIKGMLLLTVDHSRPCWAPRSDFVLLWTLDGPRFICQSIVVDPIEVIGCQILAERHASLYLIDTIWL